MAKAQHTDTPASEEDGTVALIYYRYRQRQWKTFSSVEDAVGFANAMRDEGDGWPDCVVSLEEKVLLDEAGLEAAMNAHEDELPDPVYQPPTPVQGGDQRASASLASFLGVPQVHSQEWAALPERIKSVWRAKVA